MNASVVGKMTVTPPSIRLDTIPARSDSAAIDGPFRNLDHLLPMTSSSYRKPNAVIVVKAA